MTGVSLGFTGTRAGMTENQKRVVALLLDIIGPSRVHHGGCRGADTEFEMLAMERAFKIYEHAPAKPVCAETLLERNRVIVRLSSVLLATPHYAHQEQRSGTWMTIRYAWKLHKPTLIVLPTGLVEVQW